MFAGGGEPVAETLRFHPASSFVAVVQSGVPTIVPT
jgi:hypothetical protein